MRRSKFRYALSVQILRHTGVCSARVEVCVRLRVDIGNGSLPADRDTIEECFELGTRLGRSILRAGDKQRAVALRMTELEVKLAELQSTGADSEEAIAEASHALTRRLVLQMKSAYPPGLAGARGCAVTCRLSPHAAHMTAPRLATTACSGVKAARR